MQNVPAVAVHRLAVNMVYEFLDPNDFTEKGIFKEDSFLRAVESFDFSAYSGKKVLVRVDFNVCNRAVFFRDRVFRWSFLFLL